MFDSRKRSEKENAYLLNIVDWPVAWFAPDYVSMMHHHLSIGFALVFSLELMAQSFAKDVQPFLAKYCIECHGGKKVKGKVDFTKMKTDEDLEAGFETWETALELIADGEMPPDAAEQPTAADIELIEKWYQKRFVESVEAHPGFFKPRRLSAREYRNTLKSLFGFDLEVAVIEAEQTQVEKSLVMKLMPIDPPGKSGFKNDTHGNPLTTVVWDQYSYLADVALQRFMKPFIESGVSLEEAEKLIREFVPRALRRPVDEEVVSRMVEKVRGSGERAVALKEELKVVLMSPGFIYRGVMMKGEVGEQGPVDEFELAERLSYFIWNDMPDAELLEHASAGTLRKNIKTQTDRLLESPKAWNLPEDFAIQWLALDSMDQFATKQVPLAIALKTQPIQFLNYLIQEGRPLMELIDSRTTFANPLISKFYRPDRKQIAAYKKMRGIEMEDVPLSRITLENTEGRGGLLTMPGVLAMNRGPVQRGTWILERILGVHLPDPPPDVGQVEPNRKGAELSFRERFEAHRGKATCAVCHDKIDPLGFALQAYDLDGAYVRASGFKPSKKRNKKNGGDYVTGEIDTTGQLPNGEKFKGFAELKQIFLTSQREEIIRNLVKRMLSYALCRKLEIYDQPTVEEMVKRLDENNGTWRDLIFEVSGSLPFQETVVQKTKS
ncbi:MAG: DUF1592 domain-containing protein [Rubripirellula sp.]|nr:DUF1592 domain-containing protein [Rubripirellula sp.]MDE2657273.1 DUF1592 domain-containing protein [Verrucomicrobiota bacterium]